VRNSSRTDIAALCLVIVMACCRTYKVVADVTSLFQMIISKQGDCLQDANRCSPWWSESDREALLSANSYVAQIRIWAQTSRFTVLWVGLDTTEGDLSRDSSLVSKSTKPHHVGSDTTTDTTTWSHGTKRRYKRITNHLPGMYWLSSRRVRACLITMSSHLLTTKMYPSPMHWRL